jgi:cell fate regulator YaaT (PSP1 superfamily)
MEVEEYLISFGRSGEFGRFRAATSLRLRRGERMVVSGPRGVEIGEVLRKAAPGHARFLPNTSVGQVLRRLTQDDERTESERMLLAQRLLERAQHLKEEQRLPLVFLDAEVLLDGEHAVVHQLRGAEADVRPFVAALSREFALHIALVDLSGQREHEESEGCGRPDCGQGEGGGCSSCDSGGCSSCGESKPQEKDWDFAQRREQMDRRRTALL